ncbi:dihydroorotate dehydrogenase electron transfer subunit [Allostreptomyces psammosilenae]|uniref:Dihydroorotate dehydrogenase electron transfer subunit n=1 Tax=Allostreptomyces psammosilenae TaxID=1892865 RepID=A0A852ZRI9_9ACTN|nr:dihydroorotate dehydrogenase electron transfer subunit [Allostreptomyces psammosilenae]NYI04979.1 dihydroorotate dehydrogenase electron transfer subunit [Allostreptomyces psammosilenae]
MANPLQVAAEVVSLQPAGAYHHLVLRAPGVAERVEPGHFVAVAIGGRDSATLLRRAFSIHRADEAAGTVEVVFAEHGKGTRELARVRPGDRLDVVAPLGTPFPVPSGPATALLVAGGYGSAPMFALAERILDQGGRVGFILGAATADRLYGVDQALALTPDVVVTTDDGSAGTRGLVTGPLAEAIAATGAQAVYSCGPMAMLRAVTEIATAHGARSWTAVEESMACGVGVCMTCVLPVVGNDGVSRFVRSCVDGPCFDGTKVRWSDVGTIPADVEGAAAMGVR